MGSGLFAYCRALSIVKLAPNLKTIGSCAFYQCPIQLEDRDEEVPFLYNREDQTIPWNVTELIVGKDVTHIKKEALQGRIHLVKVDMEGAVLLEIIEEGAFRDCSLLSIIKWCPNVKTIGRDAFERCSSLKEADMSKLLALETIGDGAFLWSAVLLLSSSCLPISRLLDLVPFASVQVWRRLV